MKAGFKIGQSFYDKLQQLEDSVEEDSKEFAYQVAEFAVSISPVDTGAYVTSFSMKDSYSSGRSRTSRNKPKNQDVGMMKQEALTQLGGDIEGIDFSKAQRVVLSNGAPHSNYVEHGNGYSKGYKVFEKVKDRFR